MKKGLLLFTSLTASMLLLAGCGQESKDNSQSSSSQQVEKSSESSESSVAHENNGTVISKVGDKTDLTGIPGVETTVEQIKFGDLQDYGYKAIAIKVKMTNKSKYDADVDTCDAWKLDLDGVSEHIDPTGFEMKNMPEVNSSLIDDKTLAPNATVEGWLTFDVNDNLVNEIKKAKKIQLDVLVGDGMEDSPNAEANEDMAVSFPYNITKELREAMK